MTESLTNKKPRPFYSLTLPLAFSVIVIKGEKMTQKITRRDGSFMETVQCWVLTKPRKLEDCGVWIDGDKIL